VLGDTTNNMGSSSSGNRLLVGDGGTVTAAGSATVGYLAGAHSNAVTVADPGSTWWVASSLYVGSNGSFNTLIISNSALVRANFAQIGRQSGSGSNLVVVTGSGSTWSNVGSGTPLTVGLSSSGNQMLI